MEVVPAFDEIEDRHAGLGLGLLLREDEAEGIVPLDDLAG